MSLPRPPIGSIAALSAYEGDLSQPGELDPRRYERRGEIGAGGLGRVFIADDRWLGRDVALKEALDDGHEALFVREARIAAQLDHPGILKVYDTGHSDDGRPFFAMPLIQGRTLGAILSDERDDDGRSILRVMLAVCETVAYVHDKRIYHRDLKPANIMAGRFGQTLVIDWGFAAGPGLVGVSEAPPRGGTPRYMSPEQARGLPAAATDDVYALGAVLFEVISGEPAFATMTTVTEACAERAIPLLKRAPKALAAIVARALAQAPADRYPSAGALAGDLARYLDGRLVETYAYSATERLALFLRRWRGAATVAAVALVVLVVVGIISLMRVTAERDRAEALLRDTLVTAAAAESDAEARDEARALAEKAQSLGTSPRAAGILATLPLGRPNVTTFGALDCRAIDIAIDGATVICQSDAGYAGLTLRGRDGAVVNALESESGEALTLGHGSLATVRHRNYFSVQEPETGLSHTEPRSCPGSFKPGSSGRDATIVGRTCSLILTASEQRTFAAPPCGRGGMTAAALSRDGAHYAIACDDGKVRLGAWSGSHEEVIETGLAPPWLGITAVALIPGTDELILGTQQGWLVRYDRRDPRPLRMAPIGGLIQRIAVSPDGLRAVFLADGGRAMVFDLPAFAPLERLPPEITAVNFDDDGSLWTAGTTIQRRDYATTLPRLTALSHGVTALDISRDGRHVAVGQAEWMTVVEVASRRPVGERSWQSGVVKAVAFTAEGGVRGHGIAEDLEVRFADVSLRGDPVVQPLRDSLRAVWLSDGSTLVIGWDLGARLWRNGVEVRAVDPSLFVDMVKEATTDFVAALGKDGSVAQGPTVPTGGNLTVCDVVPGGRRIATRDTEGQRGLLVATGDEILGVCGGDERYHTPDADLTSLAASRNLVAAGGRDGRVWIWRRGDPTASSVYAPHAGRVAAVGIAPDESFIVSGGWDGCVVFWAPPTQP